MKVKPELPESVGVVKLIPGMGAILDMEYDLRDKTIYWSIVENNQKTEGSFTPTVESIEIETPGNRIIELTSDDWKGIVKE